MAILPGSIQWVNYGEHPPCIHARLCIEEVWPGTGWFAIATPDLLVYEELLRVPDNQDFVAMYAPGPGGGGPAGIAPGALYGFAPLTAARFAALM